MNYSDAPQVLREFLTYHENIKGHSVATIDEYYLDLRNFLRYLKYTRNLTADDIDMQDVPISDIDADFLRAVTISEVYDYLMYLSREKERNDGTSGLMASTRARKIATIRSFFNYLTLKAKLLDENPILGIDSPKVPRSLPRYLSLDESFALLSAADGRNKVRDYCILCIFLTCGLRISEITGLNLSDLRGDHLRVTGKGDKTRVVYLNDLCSDAIESYLIVRNGIELPNEKALFLSERKNRIGRGAVHSMVKQTLKRAGLDSDMYSAHKLRHTAATLMLQNGVDIRTLQELLGHEHLNTTQIYTHVENTELRIAAQANPLKKIRSDDD